MPTSETLIFEETFDTFDHDLWKHEITMGGGGNWEFQASSGVTHLPSIKCSCSSFMNKSHFLTCCVVVSYVWLVSLQYYTNNRTNSYVQNNILYMQPTLSSQTFGEKTVRSPHYPSAHINGYESTLCNDHSSMDGGCLYVYIQVSGDEPARVDLWGMSPADACTSNQFYGCERMR